MSLGIFFELREINRNYYSQLNVVPACNPVASGSDMTKSIVMVSLSNHRAPMPYGFCHR